MNNRGAIYLKILIDLFIVLLSIWISIFFKPNTQPRDYITTHYFLILIMVTVWFLLSLIFKKYHLASKRDLRRITPVILRVNIIIVGIITLIMFGIRQMEISRFVFFGTVLFGTILELIFFLAYKQVVFSKKIDDSLLDFIDKREKEVKKTDQKKKSQEKTQQKRIVHSAHITSYITQESGEEVTRLIERYFDFEEQNFTVLSTTTCFNVLKLADHYFENIANLKRINDIRYVNKFFEAINTKLPINGYFIGCVETKNMRKKRIMEKFPYILNGIYYFFDFIFKRLAPKFNTTKKIYFFLTQGKNRVITKAETLGRLYSCGFAVEEVSNIGGLMYFIAKKIRKPYHDFNPTYGPLIKLKRIGKNGTPFYVFKFRTMHPFAEYLQPYIYQHYNLKEGGKFKNDFRITTAGKIMRKFWIDELPMFFNLTRGEMKIVGVRPLSSHYYNLYDEKLKSLRIKFKPGLVPPFYADMPKTLEEIQKSEEKYLKSYIKKPFLTDWKYFWKAFYNIVFKNARSA